MRKTLRTVGLSAALLLPLACSGDEPQAAAPLQPASAWTETPIETLQKPGGLEIEVYAEGTGSTVELYDRVEVHYRGWIAGKTKTFDSSFDRGNTFSFVLGRDPVIQGWEQGLEGLKVGSRVRLNVPFAMGYGTAGRAPMIPPNSDLVFDVEVRGASAN